MLHISDTQREAAESAATERILAMYESGECAATLWEIGQRHTLTIPATYLEFSVAVGDVILGLVPQSQLPQLLIERLAITPANAMRITGDVLDFLAPLDDLAAVVPAASASGTTPPAAATVPAAPTPTVNPVSINTPPTPPTRTTDNTLADEIAEAEAAISTMQPIRTMSHDMETMRSVTATAPAAGAEVTHQAASQSDLLDHSARVKDKNPDARWGTEQA